MLKRKCRSSAESRRCWFERMWEDWRSSLTKIAEQMLSLEWVYCWAQPSPMNPLLWHSLAVAYRSSISHKRSKDRISWSWSVGWYMVVLSKDGSCSERFREIQKFRRSLDKLRNNWFIAVWECRWAQWPVQVCEWLPTEFLAILFGNTTILLHQQWPQYSMHSLTTTLYGTGNCYITSHITNAQHIWLIQSLNISWLSEQQFSI